MNPLWQPGEETVAQANLTHYMSWLRLQGINHADYQSLWAWSVDAPHEFWPTILSYFKVQYDGMYAHVYKGRMPRATWFEGIRLNYAEHVFNRRNDAAIAIVASNESGRTSEITWKELAQRVASFAAFLKAEGVSEGDCVVAYLPCIPEATIAFLAANSIGAIWSSSSPDFGSQAVIDRFQQIKPKVLIAVDRYSYGGKEFDKSEVVEEIVRSLPELKRVVLVGNTSKQKDERYLSWQHTIEKVELPLTFTRVAFSHPIWVLYSSGTTGLPKAITHSHGGVLIEQLKYLTFHNDLHEGERLFWYTTTGWMMWNYLQGVLLCGGTAVMYDGHPGYPSINRLWEFCARNDVNHFGTSAGYILACRKENATIPAMESLRSVSSTGSTLPQEGFEWIYEHLKKDTWLVSMSGGTDVCSAFVGGNPLWPVHSGEIQCRALGCSLQAWDEDGKEAHGVGEMVITRPMPSMPVFFWNDLDFSKYTESYFEIFPGIWRHGDWIEVTPHQGVIIYGRSDATLNRGGVRIGTSEIYRTIDKIEEVKDSIILCIEEDGGEFYMPLFVMMKEGRTLDDAIKKKINSALRQDYSPRHVPDEIIAAPDIPYTISGKKTELPVKKY